MKLKICIYDSNKERIEVLRFICKNVLVSLDYDCEFIDPVEISDFGKIVSDRELILIYNPDNSILASEELVDYVILNGSSATLLTLTATSDKLFRLLPAGPFECINTDSYESELVNKLKIVVKNVISKAKGAFA